MHSLSSVEKTLEYSADKTPLRVKLPGTGWLVDYVRGVPQSG